MTYFTLKILFCALYDGIYKFLSAKIYYFCSTISKNRQHKANNHFRSKCLYMSPYTVPDQHFLHCTEEVTFVEVSVRKNWLISIG